MKLFEREVKLSVEELDGTIYINSCLKDSSHEMKINLAVNPATMGIIEVKAEMIEVPYDICQTALPKLDSLVGLAVKSGINKQVYELMGNTKGCVHIIELLRESFKGAVQGCLRYNLKNYEPEEKMKRLENTLSGTCVRYL